VTTRIGVISDTHNRLRFEAIAALSGSDLILHGGDLCRPEVLAGLAYIAPVLAVRGNNDRGRWARALPLTRRLEVEGRRIFVIHDLSELRFDPKAKGFDAVVSGHSHRPRIERNAGVLYLNPGSAGPRRFSLPVSVAVLNVSARGVRARIVELPV
jgi:putative phosphoesterase